jgi:hypothetical protein
MKKSSKILAALWLASALVPMPAFAAVQLLTSADCGDSGFQSGVTVSSYCSNAGNTYFELGQPGTFDYRIQANAATGYELGGLRTYGQVTFDDLLRGRVGAPSSYSAAGTRATATLQDTLRFSVANAAPNETLTMRSVVRMHGNYDTTIIDESKFYDGNFASMITELSVLGLGSSGGGEFHSSVDIRNKTITTLGSTDNTLIFEKNFTLNSNGLYFSFLQLQLMTTLQLVNGFDGSVGVGSGVLGADFMGTAGVVSIDLYNSLGQRMDYTLTSEDGNFAFLSVTAVPEPGAYAMMLVGLGLVGFMARSRKLARV